MGVESKNPEYIKYSEDWKKISDSKEGQQAIHSAGTAYLPKLSGGKQANDDYKAYLGRAVFYNATRRTIEGLNGMIWRKKPIVQFPAGLDTFVKDVDLAGNNITQFTRDIVDEVITLNRVGVLIDYPVTQGSNMTVAQAESLNVRPFLKKYTAQEIFNWREDLVNNKLSLVEVRLHEMVLVEKEKFEYKEIEQIRVLDLLDGVYRQRIYQKSTKEAQEWVQVGDDIIININGQTLDYIPFYFFDRGSRRPKVSSPEMIDLVNMNLSHYRTTADLEHGSHFVGLPTAVITGFQADPTKPAEYRIGAETAWIFPNEEAKAFYLEFQGQGLEGLEKRLQVKEQQMAFLGSRMLTPEKKGVEAAETAEIHRSGENSILSSIALSVSDGMEEILRIISEWKNINGDIQYTLNTDFTTTKMDAQRITALVASWQAGAIAFPDLVDNFKKGELINPSRTVEDIQAEIETSDPFNEA